MYLFLESALLIITIIKSQPTSWLVGWLVDLFRELGKEYTGRNTVKDNICL